MKKLLSIVMLSMVAAGAVAQDRTPLATLYKEFKPSVITLSDGRQLKQGLTNVFLKNSSLLYMSGEHAMEANMDQVAAVKFDDRSFVNLNNQLATIVDSVGQNVLYCVELFDQDSYERNLRNNVNLSNISLGGDQIGTTTVDLNNEEDYMLPVFRHYFMRINGDIIRVHERELLRKLNKEQRTMLKRIIELPNFSWQNEDNLKTLLKAITNE